jgi:hypothetical protein
MPPDYREIARQKAARYGLLPEVFERQIAAESNFDPNAGSSAGAIGIAQIMPDTARGWGVNPRDPVAALDAAAKNMAAYVKTYGGGTKDPVKMRAAYDNALRAYNAGPGAVEASKGKGYGETKEYVNKIIGPSTFSFTDALRKKISGTPVSDASFGAEPDQSAPFKMKEFDFNENLIASLAGNLTKSVGTPDAADVYSKIAALNQQAIDLEDDDPALADQYRMVASSITEEQPTAFDPAGLIKTVVSTVGKQQAYNESASQIEELVNRIKQSNVVQTTNRNVETAQLPNPFVPQKIEVTNPNDTGGKGFDFVIAGGKRGAPFTSPLSAEVLKISRDPREFNLEKGATQRAYGNNVELRFTTPEGKKFDGLFAHFDEVNPKLKVGTTISAGTFLGTQGRTGSTTGAHVSADIYSPGATTATSDIIQLKNLMRDRMAAGKGIFS